MEQPETPSKRHPPVALLLTVAAAVLVVAGAKAAFADPKLFRAAVVVGVCLVLWLSEAVPLYATTLLLWVGTVTLLGPLDQKAFGLPGVLSAAASPVMALFFGGFALSAAAAKYGIDAYLAGWMVRASTGRKLGLLAAVMGGTALLSMWMSNIAAAAMVIAALRPILGEPESAVPGEAADRRFRQALLLGVAFAADFGGMGTPIGTGPNLIAIGALSDRFRIRFLDWMLFGVPLAALMVALAFLLLARIYRVGGFVNLAMKETRPAPLKWKGWAVVILFFGAVAGWVLEPVHGISAAVTALAVAALLFALRLLDELDLNRLGWNTLLLIAGGITVGDLFHNSGLDTALPPR